MANITMNFEISDEIMNKVYQHLQDATNGNISLADVLVIAIQREICNHAGLEYTSFTDHEGLESGNFEVIFNDANGKPLVCHGAHCTVLFE